MADNQAIKDCPYWSPNCAQLCAMTECGLYVPLPKHIVKFCSTLQWPECPQYVRGCEAQFPLAWNCETEQDKGRRRFPRLRLHHSFTLSVDDNLLDSSAKIQEQRAWALDFSLGGMRIETAAALPAAAKINFSFGGDFLYPGFTGQADVCWQRPRHSAGTHQCGLGFIK